MKFLRVTITILLIICIQFLSAQEYIVETEKLTPNEGLANIQTSAVFHDENGFVWISTRYGLNRYDGYNFKLYTKEQHGLYENENIYQIQKGENNTLWLIHGEHVYGSTNCFDKCHIDVFDKNQEKVYSFSEYQQFPI